MRLRRLVYLLLDGKENGSGPLLLPFPFHNQGYYAVLVGVANGDGTWRGLVTIVDLIDPSPYIVQPAVYGRLIYL